jgi:aldehyde:ferredoxin oxidoreductase
MPTGPAKGGLPDLDYMLDEYYELRGSDKENGYPKKSRLEKLNLGFVADDLEKRKMLARQ